MAQSIIEENEISELDGTDRMCFVSLYLDVKSKLTRQLNATRKFDLNPRSSTLRQFSLDESPYSQTSLRKTKVPEIQLPKFVGAYSEWPNFFSLFKTVIHNNNDLSKLEKFHYLRASLGEAALDTIVSLELNDANYEEALLLLKNRFDNKLLNFQTHIKEIFSLNCVENGSAVSLRRLSDKLNAHLRAMQTIGNQQQIADGLLIYLVSTKLDTKTRMKWEENLSINELPTWNSMSTFLERRCRMVENLENSALSKSSNPPGSKKLHQQYRHVHVSTATSSALCTFCDSKDHFITKCSLFGNLSPSLRFKEAKRLRLCLNCLKKGHMLNSCISGNCQQCSLKHHTMLHIEKVKTDEPTKSSADQTAPTTSQAVLISSGPPHFTKTPSSNVLLATAIVMVKNQFGFFVPCRIILDSASQLSLITRRFVNQLCLKCNRIQASISGIGDGGYTIDKSVDIVIKSLHGDYSTTLTAMVVPSITDYQPDFNRNRPEWNIPKNIELADPSFDKCGRIDGLIGAELFFDLMSVGQVKLADNLPVLQKTLIGWVVAGGGFRTQHYRSLAVSCNTFEQENQLCSIIKGFWEVENNFEINPLSIEDIHCENHFLENTVRLNTGEFSVRLPQIEGRGADSLGESYSRALHRFKTLERKLKKLPDIKAQYAEFMSEYIALNHMSLISPQSEPKKYFLPHHCVHKIDSTSTKLRVVFDGSAKTTSGLSLNDILYAGPTIQPKLFNTLLRYRFFKVALSGDICKMYRCVRLSYPDDYLQCILWRADESEEIKTYKLNTVTYGTKPAAFLAIRTMHQLATEEEGKFSLAAKIVRRDFYVDDMISGGDTVEEAMEIRQQVAALLQTGNFFIRKWCSNVPAVLNEVPPDQCEQFLKFKDGTDVTKTLGLVWDPKSDNFIFSFTPVDNCKVINKRSILSSIARLYDPLGLIGPVITKAKIFMQHLWKLQLQWDESLPQSLHLSWLEYISKFDSIHYFTFPRYVSTPNSKIEIHAFCDASLAAYGVCVYIRTELDGVVKLSLLCSKSRVSPLKSLTVPKLELSAACLLAELVDVIINTLPFDCVVHCWSDSMVVLSWLREQPSNFNVFVSNRVSRIQTLTSQMSWHYVPTKLNPADILSRGASPEELLNSTLWSCGPNFLRHEPSMWPDSVDGFAVGFVDTIGKNAVLTPSDIKNGTQLLIKNIQLTHFAPEYKVLKANQNISSSSKLFSLMPIIDSIGLIRVGGRLQHSILDFDARHPVILPKQHPFTKSLVMYYHQKLLHAGPQCLLASIRQQYWPLGGRKLISSIISKCLRCYKLKPKLSQHVMGCLPPDRVRPNNAFHTTGVDYCGPFYYKSEVRNRPPVKCYISIFICFSTKASHLEVVQDLSTSSFLSALRRFVAIRGKPKVIWSDNATNFVGAKNELAELKQLFFSQSHQKALQQQCLEDGIEWSFIPPRSPHFGGLWEAAVKSAKLHFYRTVGLNKLTFDELRTLICEISAILNSRPLCPISEDPNDLEVLTPGHFLIGGPLISIVEPSITDLDISRLSRWQRVCQMKQIFWQRWSNSYLTLLQEHTKWREQTENIVIGSMVLLKDENQQPLKWQIGRITDVIRGDDNVVRVVMVQTSNGLMKRAVSKVAVLPIDSLVESRSLPTGGGC
ncbi:uncharacterized protein LOC119603189 [Lucilia sericata]|uniref:uncharacterized protein LOC119603189 n=1 Tax=Lucilia sericata TaxID=13632 RepID=UPI0018A87202|nr:uncharacterized protein LOC119603189 [Lucilia sericata]